MMYIILFHSLHLLQTQTLPLSSRFILRPANNTFLLVNLWWDTLISLPYNIHVVFMLQSINSFSSPSCEFLLYTNNTYLDNQNPSPIRCNHELYLSNEPVTASGQSTLLISLNHPLDRQLNCQKSNFLQDILVPHVYALKQGCSLTTRNINLKTLLIYQKIFLYCPKL